MITGLRALKLEWGNPSYDVTGLRALIGECSFRSVKKHIRKGGDRERMKVSIGIDIGKKKCDWCALDGRGNVLERGQYSNTLKGIDDIVRYITTKYRRRGNTCKAACETTANMWYMTYDKFESAKIDIKLANTLKMGVVVKTAKKTDRIDAQKIAEAVRIGSIPECYVPTAHIRGVRTLARYRMRLARDRTNIINYTRSLLDRFAIHPNGALYRAKTLEFLESTNVGTSHDTLVLKRCISQIRYITNEMSIIEKDLDKEAAINDDAKLLMSLTGVGTYLAVLLAAEIADISRFDTPKQMISWGGLCPSVYQSGDTFHMGRRKKLDTDDITTWAMCQAANNAAVNDPRMKKVYESARRRHADKHALAVVIVAHKMLNIAWHMLKTRTPYSSRKELLYDFKLEMLEEALKQ